MDKDKSLKRVLTALDLKIPDKIPFHAYESPEHAIKQLGYKVHQMYLEPDLLPRAMIHTAKKYHNDIIYMRTGTSLSETHKIIEKDDALVWLEKKTGEVLGRVLYNTRTFISAKPKLPLVESVRDIEKIKITPWKTILQNPVMQSLKLYVDEFKGKRFLFGFAAGQSANALYTYLGTEKAMTSVLTDPGLCRVIMEKQYEQIKERIMALKALGTDGIYTGDACASCSLFSPTTYKKLFFEYQKRSIDFVHRQGMRALLHVCGKISPILEDMTKTGADVIESLDAHSSGGDIDLKDAKQRVGDNVCLKGNIDAVHVIEPLKAEEIYAICTEAMHNAGPNGYILSSEQITRDTPSEHVLAMVQARNDFKLS